MATSGGSSPGDAIVPIEELLLLPGVVRLATWEANAALAQLPDALQQRLASLLDELKVLYGPPSQAVTDAALAGDGRALAALVQLDGILGDALDRLMPRIREAKQVGDWHRLAHEASLAVHLAEATGRDADLALAAHLQANAQVGLGDLAGAVMPFRRSIAAAAVAGDLRLQSVGHDNLGNALRDSGDFDAALAEYAAALDVEADPRGRALVLSNQAVALECLGERDSALQTLLAQVDALRTARAPAAERVTILGRAAYATLECGDAGGALTLLDQAEAHAAADDLAGRAMLAGLRARAAGAQGDAAGADIALEQAWQLARNHAAARLQPRVSGYAHGFDAALAHRLPTERALQLLSPSIAEKDANRWQQALQGLQVAEHQARQAGDMGLALRIAANCGAAFFEAGQMGPAQQVMQAVQAESFARGLAHPEAMAWGTLGSVAAQTGELVMGLDITGLLAMAEATMEIHGELLAGAALSDHDKAFEAIPNNLVGSLFNERALSALRWGAWAQAARHFDRAAGLVRPFGASFPLANRLAGLLDACTRLHDAPRAASVAAELESLLDQLQPRARLVAERALAQHLDDTDAARALEHWQQAAALAERLRAALPGGLDASQVNRGYPRLPMQCAQRVRRAGHEAEAWQVLQQGKSRRILDARAPDQPLPTLDEVRRALQPDELLVDVAIEDDGLAAYRLAADGFDAVFEPMDIATLAAPELADLRQREHDLLTLARTHAGLAAWATRVVSGWAQGRKLLLVPDGPLHNLPLHEIRIGRQPWHEQQPIGLLPCAAWLLRATPLRAEACLVAGNSDGNLGGAERECQDVAKELGTTALTGARCTRAALETALQGGPLDIVHLAVHGRGDAQHGARASLLLADGLDGIEWVPFESLAQRNWQANLVVLSGCSTGVAGPLHGHEMVSVARAALEAGAASVLASLWPVADQAAAAFMTAFHESVARQRRHGNGDLRVALEEARRSVSAQPMTSVEIGRRRDGRRINEPALSTAVAASEVRPGDASDAVAAFVLIGRPTLDRQGAPEDARAIAPDGTPPIAPPDTQAEAPG